MEQKRKLGDRLDENQAAGGVTAASSSSTATALRKRRRAASWPVSIASMPRLAALGQRAHEAERHSTQGRRVVSAARAGSAISNRFLGRPGAGTAG